MINNDQSTSLLYCCKDVKSHRSEGDTVPCKSLKCKQSVCLHYGLYSIFKICHFLGGKIISFLYVVFIKQNLPNSIILHVKMGDLRSGV